MDVGFRIGWKIEIEDEVDGGNVQTASRDVGGDEDLSVTGTEFIEGAETGGLGELAVQGNGGVAEGSEEKGDA